MAKGKDVLEIIRAISSIVSEKGYDGALDDEGERIEIGLKRDEGHPILDSRVMDGFSVQFQGNLLVLNYQSEIKLSEVHEKGFENDINAYIRKIASFLRSEYKKSTGKGLTLSPQGESKILVQQTSRVRTWVQATQIYKIGGVAEGSYMDTTQENKLEDNIKKWIKQSTKDIAKPENVSVSPSKQKGEVK
jgi:hypothetical protein